MIGVRSTTAARSVASVDHRTITVDLHREHGLGEGDVDEVLAEGMSQNPAGDARCLE
jgi:hypothetical protein